jgi:signal transduction histidine kinase
MHLQTLLHARPENRAPMERTLLRDLGPVASGVSPSDLQSLVQLLDIATLPVPLEEQLDALVRYIEGFTPGMRCTILLADVARGRLRSCVAPSISAAYAAAVDDIPIAEGVGSCGTAAARRSIVVVADIARSPLWVEFRDVAIAHGLAACWSTPLIAANGELLGTSAMYYSTPRSPTGDELKIMSVVGTLASLIIQRHRDGVRLQNSERLYRQVAETCPNPVLLHAGGVIAYGNAAAEALLSAAVPATLVGQRIDAFFSPETRVAVLAHRAGNLTAVLQRPGAPDIAIEISAAAVEIDDRATTLLVMHDISELHTVNQQTRHENELLEQKVVDRTTMLELVNRQLDAFCYSVAHDLRTPLRAINGYATIVLQDYATDLPAECVEYIEKLRRYGLQMGSLVDDLLNFSRLGQAKFSRTPVDTQGLVRDLWQELVQQDSERRIELVMRALHPCVGDRALLRQVWLNLLTNAIKYTRPTASARVVVSSELRDGQIVYCVEDNGVGFDPRYSDKLFQVFERLHSAPEFEGNGVGLAIVKQVIERHGGRVWAESVPREGARFYFSLPQ